MSRDRDQMGSRFKQYEAVSDYRLTRKVPVICRIDGKAFHTLTRNMTKPFDSKFMESMKDTAAYLCAEIQGCKFAFVQSDEISLLLTDWDKLDTEPWFGYRLSKMISISACLAANAFHTFMDTRHVEFDSRAFNLPESDVCNYFLWRQKDTTRNSVQMVAQANFSHKSLQGLSSSQLQEKLFQEKGINWDALPTPQKRGTAVYRKFDQWYVDEDIPIFSQDRNFVEKWLEPQDDNVTDKNLFGY
jgi:tRNA(His) guanylyltransferase